MSMADREGWIWLDGEWLPWRDARVHVMTHTLHYGLGCFEGLRAYPTADGPAIFRLTDHVERLFDSARILGIEVGFDSDTVALACREAVRRNGLQQAYVRPLLFLGADKAGIDPAGASSHLSIVAWAWGNTLGQDALEAGIRVKVSSFARHHVNAHMRRAKSVSAYTNSIMACREVRAEGFDEALMLDTDGFVAEGPGENVFVVRRGVLYEPELTAALDGITRRTVQVLAHEAGYEVCSRRISRDELYVADEVFFTGTAAEITPVIEIDRRPVVSGRPGPMTRTLQSRYFTCVEGRDPRHADWLSMCD